MFEFFTVESFSYAASAALVVLGAVATVNSDWTGRHKISIGTAFVVLGLIALALTRVQSTREDSAAKRRDEAVTELQTALAEQTRLTTLNTKLQEQIVVVSNEIVGLSKENRQLASEALRVAIGDPENPPYLWSDFDFKSKPLRSLVYVMNPSKKYAAHSVAASLILDGSLTATSRGSSVPPNHRVPAAFPNKSGFDSNLLNLPQLDTIGNRITFYSMIASSAGSYHQLTAMVRASETTILQATRVSKVGDGSKTIFSRQDKDFPSDYAWPTSSVAIGTILPLY